MSGIPGRVTRSRIKTIQSPTMIGLLVALLIGVPSAAPYRDRAASAASNSAPAVMNNSIFRTFGASTSASFAGWDFTYLAQAEQHATANGIRDNRIPLFWNINQPSAADRNYFDWTVNDSIIRTMPPGTTLLGMVGNNIDWTPLKCSLPGGCTGPAFSIDGMLDQTRPALAGTDKLWSDWDIYVYKTVSRYGSRANNQGTGYGQNRIKTWEVMNEIDGTLGHNYTDAQIADRGQKYGQILIRTTQIIKLADPDAQILSCGISDYFPYESAPNQMAMLPRTKLWVDSVAATGAYNGVDGFSVHAYWALGRDGGTSMKSYLENYHDEVFRVTGRSIPLWVTESSYMSDSLGQGCGPGCWATPETESRMMIQNLTQFVGNSVTAALYWFNTNTYTPQGANWDPDSYSLAKQCKGSTDWIESARGEAFYSFKSKVFDKGYTYISYQSAGDVSFFVFGNGSDYLHILWSKSPSTTGFTTLDPTAFGSLSITDYLGNGIKPTGSPTTAQLILTQEPIFLYSPTRLDIQSLTFSPGPPLTQRSVGYVSANCDTITGWACNAGDNTRPLTVGIYDGDISQGNVVAYLSANQLTGNSTYDDQVASNCGGFGSRSFGMPTPLWLKKSGQHTISAYAVNLDGSPATKLLVGSPNAATFNCVSVAPPARPGAPGVGAPPPQPTSRPGPPASPVPIPAPIPVPR